jgi:hypothetical protein
MLVSQAVNMSNRCPDRSLKELAVWNGYPDFKPLDGFDKYYINTHVRVA